MIDWNDCDFGELSTSRKKDLLNCPNCGAPINDEQCPYCGTAFVDFAAMDTERPFYVKIKQGDDAYIFKVRLRNVELTQESGLSYGRGYLCSPQSSLEIGFDVL